MTDNERLEKLKTIFNDEMERLKSKGVEITDWKGLWNNEKIRNEFLLNYVSHSTDEEKQSWINEMLAEVNKLANSIGEPELEFCIYCKLERMPKRLTAAEYMEIYKKRNEQWHSIICDIYNLAAPIKEKYLSIKFDEAVNEGIAKNAHAIYFITPAWKGFLNEETQSVFEETLEEIKSGTYTGTNIYCSSGVGADALVILLKEDMERTKEIFMSPGKGYMLLSKGGELNWEFL